MKPNKICNNIIKNTTKDRINWIYINKIKNNYIYISTTNLISNKFLILELSVSIDKNKSNLLIYFENFKNNKKSIIENIEYDMNLFKLIQKTLYYVYEVSQDSIYEVSQDSIYEELKNIYKIY